jgi:hypothetical protein
MHCYCYVRLRGYGECKEPDWYDEHAASRRRFGVLELVEPDKVRMSSV